MENVMAIINWVMANKSLLVEGYLMIVGGASIIVKVLPTFPEGTFIKSILRFLGKYVSLNRK
jgi:hypothetical protein